MSTSSLPPQHGPRMYVVVVLVARMAEDTIITESSQVFARFFHNKLRARIVKCICLDCTFGKMCTKHIYTAPASPVDKWSSVLRKAIQSQSPVRLENSIHEVVYLLRTSECLIWRERNLWSNFLRGAVYLPRTSTRGHVFLYCWNFISSWSLSRDQKYN